MGHAAGDADRGADGSQGVRLLRAWCAAAALSVVAASVAFGQTWRTLTSARQAHGEDTLTVDVQYAAGRFTLGAADAGTLYHMDLQYDEDRFAPVRQYDPATGTLHLGVRSRDGETHVSLGDHDSDTPPSTLDLALEPGLPLSLDLDLGAAQADLDLGGLAVRRMRYRTGASTSRVRFGSANTTACESLRFMAGAATFQVTGLGNADCRRLDFEGGVGEVTLDFSGAWRQSMDADVSVTLGSLHLALPRDVGVALKLDRLLATFDHDGFVKRGDTYYSANYDTTRYHLTLNVTATFGGVDVTWIDR